MRGMCTGAVRDDDDDPLDGRESGPYCPHWGDPSDCDEACKCGHECRSHGDCFDGYSCMCTSCPCVDFTAQGGAEK